MFDPTYTEEQTALVDTARKFTRETVVPQAHHYDEKEEFPTPIFQAAWDLGLMNVELPEAYGGLGLHTLDGCLVAEELAYGCPAVATSILCNHLGSLPLLIAAPWGLLWGPTCALPYIPLPAKITVQIGDPIPVDACDGRELEERAPQLYRRIEDTMQSTLDSLYSERIFPILG